jgi:NAD+ diphosphatase
MEEIYTFAGNPLDRVSDRRRDAMWVEGLIGNRQSRVLPLFELKPLIRDPTHPALDWQDIAAWRGPIASGAILILLGLDEAGRAHFAIDASAAESAIPAGAESVDVRALAPQIPGGAAAILAEARSLIDWHQRHGFCPQCGTPTDIAAAGWTRRCPNCRAHHFPRTDPVVIMLTVRGDRALLGRGRRRVGARFSCLAGFMEPGETLEEAVRREVFEESGIRVGQVRYLASQPWPFPSSLMIGCLAEGLTEEITIDPEEIAEARWFHRDEIRAMVVRAATGPDDPTQVSIPPPLAIAHQLCRRWSNRLDEL